MVLLSPTLSTYWKKERERERESHGVDLTVGLIVSQGLHDMQSDSVALVRVLPAALHCSDCISMKSIHSNENHAGLKETHHRKILLLLRKINNSKQIRWILVLVLNNYCCITCHMV